MLAPRSTLLLSQTGLGTVHGGVLLTVCSSFILLTWPYHFSRFSVIFFDACTTLVVPLMCSFRILSLLVTPHIHLSIVISFTSSRASCPLVVAQVSAPYNRAGLTKYCVTVRYKNMKQDWKTQFCPTHLPTISSRIQ